MRYFALEGKNSFDLLNQGNDEIQTLNNWKWLQHKHQTLPARRPSEPTFPPEPLSLALPSGKCGFSRVACLPTALDLGDAKPRLPCTSVSC